MTSPVVVGLVVGVGIVVVLLTLDRVMYLDVFGIGRRRATAGLPALAEELGLKFQPGAGHKTGEAIGEIDGLRVTLAPDRRATVAIDIAVPGEFRLGTTPFRGKPFPGLQHFDSGSESFDRVFPTRFADSATASRLAEGLGELGLIAKRAAARPSAVKYVQISHSGVRCSFRHGSSSYLDPTTVRQFLPELMQIALGFQRLLASDQQDDGPPKTD